MDNILIEGANASGKTTAMNVLRELYPESSFYEFHDFYHEHVMYQFGMDSLYLPNHWHNMESDKKQMMEQYLRDRESTIFSLLNCQKYNRNIIERLVITHCVYSKLILGVDIEQYLLDIEQKLIDNNIVIILVTCEENEFRKILKNNIDTKPGRNAPTSQYHLKDVEIGIQKDKLYNYYFDLLKHVKKVRIVNDNTGVSSLKEKIINATKDLSL